MVLHSTHATSAIVGLQTSLAVFMFPDNTFQLMTSISRGLVYCYFEGGVGTAQAAIAEDIYFSQH